MGRGLHLLCPVVASCFNVAGEVPLSRSRTGRSGGGGVGVERVPLRADSLLVGSHILICPRGILLTRPEAPSPLPPTRSGIWENLFLDSSLVRPSSHFHPVRSLLYCWEICREGLLPAKSLPSNQGLFHSRWKWVSGTSAAAGCTAPAVPLLPWTLRLSLSYSLAKPYLRCTGGGLWTCFHKPLPTALGLTLKHIAGEFKGWNFVEFLLGFCTSEFFRRLQALQSKRKDGRLGLKRIWGNGKKTLIIISDYFPAS